MSCRRRRATSSFSLALRDFLMKYPAHTMATGVKADMIISQTFRLNSLGSIFSPSHGGFDAAARIHLSIAEPIKLRNPLPPLASNDLFGGVEAPALWRDSVHLADNRQRKREHHTEPEDRSVDKGVTDRFGQ